MSYPAGVTGYTIGSPMNDEEIEVEFDITLKATVVINCSPADRQEAIERARESARSDAIYDISQFLSDYEVS